MSKFIVPENYVSYLGLYDTQAAISLIKRTYQETLADALHLKRVSAPLFVEADSGLNDDLNGFERAVGFDIPSAKKDGVVIHSLAKWKRMALHDYKFFVGNGLYTDMNAIRRDEDLDNLHSIYVDQWDWEKVISKEDRNLDYLFNQVSLIVKALVVTQGILNIKFPAVESHIREDVYFISSEDLLKRYPDLSAKEREKAICREYGTVFIYGIGDKLSNGQKHDGRAPDYDDWSLNGDLLVYYDVLDCAMELSSMGIRVDAKALDYQLKAAGADERRKFKYHQMILNDELPYTIGGGIGQSRLCMLLMKKAHIGEVHSSIWDEDTRNIARDNKIILL